MTQINHTPQITKLKLYGVGIKKDTGEQDIGGTAEYEATGVSSAKELEAFIERACNSHYELLEALKNMVADVELHEVANGAGSIGVPLAGARAAIAKAKGK